MLSDLIKIFSEDKVKEKKFYFEILIDKIDLLSSIKKLKDNKKLLFDQLIDITAIDYPTKSSRFELVYIFLSMVYNKRVILKTYLEDEEEIESITSVFKSANWFERECFDLFGIKFINHPDLRKILTDYNFEGYPLRKDFPLTGHTEVRYDDLEKKVVYEPVRLAQEYRNFDYLSPWEGISNTLEGDDKAKKNDEEG